MSQINWKYLLGKLLILPLLPVMYYQGKQIRKNVPKLAEATEPFGRCVPSIKPSGNIEYKVLYIGESTVAGIGVDKHENGLAGTNAQLLADAWQSPVSWHVYARSGYTVQALTQKILPKVRENEADLIVVGIGGNDAFKLNNPSKWRIHVRELITSLRDRFPEAPIVFMNMPPIKSFPAFTPLIRAIIGNLVEILGSELKKIVADYPHVYYHSESITIHGWMEKHHIQGSEKDFFSDGVHPSPLTYHLWAKEMAWFIQQNLPHHPKR
jgi:lysophospholipase L1-like esterase